MAGLWYSKTPQNVGPVSRTVFPFQQALTAFERSQTPSNRDHKALHGGTLGGLGYSLDSGLRSTLLGTWELLLFVISWPRATRAAVQLQPLGLFSYHFNQRAPIISNIMVPYSWYSFRDISHTSNTKSNHVCKYLEYEYMACI